MASTDNLFLIVEAARMLEQKRTSSNDPGHHVHSQSGSKKCSNKQMKSVQVAQAPTTVDAIDLDSYKVDIVKEDNPFGKDDEEDDSEDDMEHSPQFDFPKLKFQGVRPISHAKMIHNAKEKNRRKTLKQAQLALHRQLHPLSHQKPVLRIILRNAIEEIKRLKTTFEENERRLATLKEEQSFLTEQLDNSKVNTSVQENCSNDVFDDDNEINGISGSQSVDNESIIDVEEEFQNRTDDLKYEEKSKQAQEGIFISGFSTADKAENPGSISRPNGSTSLPSTYSPLYYNCTAAAFTNIALLQAYMNNSLLWPWPNLHALHSAAAGVYTVNTSPRMQSLNVANGHHQRDFGSLACSPPVKCSVVKTIGSIDDKGSHCESLSSSSSQKTTHPFIYRQLC